jgi:hypothetical protein
MRHIGGRARAVAAALVAGLAVGALAACAGILGIDSDRSVGGADSAALVEAAVDTGSPARPDAADSSAPVDAAIPYPPPWDCLNEAGQTFDTTMTTVQIISTDALQTVLTAQKVDGGMGLIPIAYTPLFGFQMRACSSVLDPTCSNTASSPWVSPTEAGVFTFTLPQDFFGYFQLGNTDAGLFTTTLFPSKFLTGPDPNILPGPFLTVGGAEGLEVVLPNLPVSFDPDSGVGSILLAIYDCNDRSADGVEFVPSLTTDGGMYPTTIFYTQGDGVQEVPTIAPDGGTDISGAAGIMNVPAKELTVNAYLKSTKQLLASVNLFVNPGVASYSLIRARTH